MAAGAAPHLPRHRRVLTAVVVAAVVGAVAVTVAIDVVSVQTAGHSLIWPYRQIAAHLRTTRWSQTSVIVTAAVVAVIGFDLLMAALTPGRSKLLAVHGGAADESVGIPARSVRRTLANAALGVDGVRGADVSLGRSRADVTVDTPLRDPGDLHGAVERAVSARLTQLELRKPPTIRVKVRRPAPDKADGTALAASAPAGDRSAGADPGPTGDRQRDGGGARSAATDRSSDGDSKDGDSKAGEGLDDSDGGPSGEPTSPVVAVGDRSGAPEGTPR